MTNQGLPRRSALVLLGGVPLAVAIAGRAMASETTEGDLRPGGAFDRFVAGEAARDRFSGTVLLAHRDRPTLLRAYGMADRSRSIPNRPETVFALGSITKCFTGLAVAQLAARRALRFGDELSLFLDGFPAGVTVHHLLTHTSGLGRPPLGAAPVPGSTVDEVFDGTLAAIRATPPQFAPGTRYAYSNDGFWILGAIVAKVSGQSYFDYVREHVFTPAGMTTADFLTRPRVLADPTVARPYWTQPGGGRADFTTSPHFEFVRGPDAGAYATAADLLRFDVALRAGTLLDPAFADLVTGGKVPVPPNGKPAMAKQWFTGYGFEHYVVGDRRAYGHPGGGPGIATNFDSHPEAGWVAVILGNYDTSIDPLIGRSRQIVAARR
jgi:CubicO group peptidase (beta-lactamase class C family)